VGGVLYLSNLPGPTSTVCCIGTKRIVTDNVSIALVALSTGGILPFTPIIPSSLVITDGTVTFTDDGNGNLLGSASGLSGVVNYTTGVWSTNYKLLMTAHSTASYEYNEDITSEYILSWLLYYIKALVKQCEGNILRKVDAIDIKNDGALLYSEGAEEKKELEKKLNIEGRWLSFIRRF
jgi:hypothetical protein